MNRCLLDCAIAEAFEVMKCAPWQVPWTTKIICDPKESSEFLKIITNGNANCNHCKPDCQMTEFDFSLSSAPFRKCDSKSMQETQMCRFELANFKPQNWADEAIEVSFVRVTFSMN